MGPQNTLAIRIPNHPFCKLIANSCTVPITTTSVNRTGEPPKNNVEEILNSFPTEIDLIIKDADSKEGDLKKTHEVETAKNVKIQ